MEREGVAAEPAEGLKAGRVSVSGMKATWAEGPAALVDFQRPPPAVPTKRVLPVGSVGSRAREVMRPEMAPKLRDWMAAGPAGVQGAESGARAGLAARACARARARVAF